MPNKAVVIGLDGVPFSLLQKLILKGIMPNFAKIASQGVFVPMETTFPEVSSVSWTSFMTGKNPGEHGIYGFMELKPGSYQMTFPNSGNIRAKTIWEHLGEEGKRSVVLNLPQTYPAKPMNGILTSGFVALDLKKATYPDSAYEYLNKIGYKIDVEAEKAQTSLAALADDINLTFTKRREAFLHFLTTEPWDLFIAIVTETDRLHHFLWAAWEDEKHPQHQFFLDFYRQTDALIGEVAAKLPPETDLYLLSDHGFCGIKQEVYLSYWLSQEGYLKFDKEPPDSFNDINSTTKAFALDPSRIYIHLEGKYPRGTVKQADYNKLRQEIKAKLLQLSFNNEKVIKAVYLKEEIYQGPYLDQAPDLVVWSERGYDLKGSIKKQSLFGRTHFSGAHTRDDAFFLADKKLDLPNDFNITKIASLILSA